MEHVWTVFCRRVLIDDSTNQMTLIDAVESVSIALHEQPRPGEAFFQIEAALATLWIRSEITTPEKGDIRVTLHGPSGRINSVEPLILPIDLTVHGRQRSKVTIPALPFGEPGRYVFEVEVNEVGEWRRVAGVPYELTVKEDERPAETPKRKVRRNTK
jgi:hypothetical protein